MKKINYVLVLTLVMLLGLAGYTTYLLHTAYWSAKISAYEGPLGSLTENQTFLDFLADNDGRVVYLNVYMDVVGQEKISGEKQFSSAFQEDDGFFLFRECYEESGSCVGTEINLSGQGEASYSYVQGSNVLKGYWSVLLNPGMWQGNLSISLSAHRPIGN